MALEGVEQGSPLAAINTKEKTLRPAVRFPAPCPSPLQNTLSIPSSQESLNFPV